MKRYGFIIALMLLLSVNSAFCYDFKRATDDSRIVSALKVLEETHSGSVLESIFNKDKKGRCTQIIFYNLGMVSYEYKKHYAMTSTDNFGQNYIMINSKYRNAPKEALAALIAHESFHKLEKADLKEEIGATVVEAIQWKKSTQLNPALKDSDDPLIKRLNNLVKLYDENGESAINKNITDNEFYKVNLL